MSAESKKSMGWTIILMTLGVVALYAGAEWLLLLVPAAVLVWYGARPRLRRGRN
ncbi:MAG: hypothetical protein LAO24_01205 [Acidobacteriia bacterium]|nr:hypothetical protein [Terriglobia bacterium]